MRDGLWFSLVCGFFCYIAPASCGLFCFVYYLLFRFAAFCLSNVVTPRNEESTLDQRIGIISGQFNAVTPTQEESRFAQRDGVIGSSNDEIASAKDLV